ncbi:MAG: M15 family metallopeptidase [Paenisporosarcina sp.]
MANARDRGWGDGWPNCQTSKITQIDVGGTKFPGGVRTEIAELVTRLVQETKNRGYVFGNVNDPNYGCWGYMCRAIRGTQTPSNHSWGLAIDINAPTNPHKAPPIVTDMPSWMPELWTSYGFRWGGTYSTRPDAMHYEFMGTPADAVSQTERARQANLGGQAPQPIPPPPPQPQPTVPAFPFPKGHWMGVESNDPKNHSGALSKDKPGVKQYQQRMKDRGWNVGSVDGIFGPKTKEITVSYQKEKNLTADGLAGEKTWHSIWTAPVT